jgi:hypothetical protein
MPHEIERHVIGLVEYLCGISISPHRYVANCAMELHF